MNIAEIKETEVDYKESYNKAWIQAVEAVRKGEIEESVVKEIFEPVPEHQIVAAQAMFSTLNRLESKRVFPKLKGEEKAKFEYEFNTLKQVLNLDSWPGNQIVYARRFALLWATWGAYNLSDYFKMSSEERDKMDIIKY